MRAAGPQTIRSVEVATGWSWAGVKVHARSPSTRTTGSPPAVWTRSRPPLRSTSRTSPDRNGTTNGGAGCGPPQPAASESGSPVASTQTVPRTTGSGSRAPVINLTSSAQLGVSSVIAPWSPRRHLATRGHDKAPGGFPSRSWYAVDPGAL